MVVLKDGSVVLLLHRGQFDVNDGLFLRRNITGDVLFHTTQQMRRNAALQLLDLVK